VTANAIPLDELVHALDEFYALHEWESDPAMSRFLPRVYRAIGIDHARILEPDFCRRTNGLMLRSGTTVSEVYCAAFPCPEVLQQLMDTAGGDALLFLHHPIDMEVSGVGFLPITPEDLRRLQARGVSIYACHAPMDCHDQIGTNAAIVQALGIEVQAHFSRYGNGYAGRIGTIAPATLEALVRKGRQVFGVDRVEIGGARPEPITRVAVVAGGGDDVADMREAERLGAQAYITGEWYTRTTPSDPEDRAWAEGNRAACQAYAERSAMAFLGFSHAASEYLVMVEQMAGYFQGLGLRVTCLPQSDWWR
jgi:putative NIF3 family GTP cyclohydrolase 1 type 2